MEKQINGMQPERYLASILLMDSSYRGASYYDKEDKYTDMIASHKNLLINGAKVYVVKVIEMDGGIPMVHVEVFSTKESAKAFFDTRVVDYKMIFNMEKYGSIEDETDDLFSWTAEIGFCDNTVEITIDECEVK